MYSNKESVESFWASNPTEASGRDPLGIKNSSAMIYSGCKVAKN